MQIGPRTWGPCSTRLCASIVSATSFPSRRNASGRVTAGTGSRSGFETSLERFSRERFTLAVATGRADRRARDPSQARRGLLLRRERSNVVDDAPDLVVGNAAVPPGHHRWRKAPLDDGVDFAVTRHGVPLVVGQIRRLLSTLFLDDRDADAGFHRALRHVAMTRRAVRVVGLLPGGDRLRRR